MQGSSGNTPIIVRESWLWRIVLPVTMAGFTALVLLPETSNSWPPILTDCLVACGWAFCLLHLLRPPRLEIWPDKLVRRDILGLRHTYAFADIAEFFVWSGARSGTQICFNWAEDAPRCSRYGLVSRFLAGSGGSLGGGWDMPAQELADMLNRCRLLPSAWS